MRSISNMELPALNSVLEYIFLSTLFTKIMKRFKIVQLTRVVNSISHISMIFKNCNSVISRNMIIPARLLI